MPGTFENPIGAHRRAVLGALAAIVAAAAALRFVTLGQQSYHHDEAWTVVYVISGGFHHMLHQVKATESNPPLYYILAWGWTQLFGLGEVGLRSLSALFGLAVVPVGYLIGRQLSGRRAGLVLAAFLAFNPMLIWYSQEARSYVLLIFFGALSFYFFLRALETQRELDLGLWVLSSTLAVCSHYFALFAVGIEAVWLAVALRSRWRLLLPALIGLAAVGVALLPLVSSQINDKHIGWISDSGIVGRLVDAGAASTIGETGNILGLSSTQNGYAIVPLLLAAGAAVLVLGWGSARERRGAALAALLGFGVVALACGAAAAGKDYVLARNLLPALVPLVAVVALGCATRRARWAGLVLAAALCGFWLAFDVYVTQTPKLQRAEVRTISARLGPPVGRRAIASWTLMGLELKWYLHAELGMDEPQGDQKVREVAIISRESSPPKPAPELPAALHFAERIRLPRYTVDRYVAKRAVKVSMHALYGLPTGYSRDSVVFDTPAG